MRLIVLVVSVLETSVRFGYNVKECVIFFGEGTGGFFGSTASHGGFFRGWGVFCVEDEGDTVL